MNTTFRIISDKSRYIVAALLVAFSVFVPMLASAAQVTERSITLSSATKQATAVRYNVEFTAPAAADEIVIDFCTNSPLIGETCTPPPGLVVDNAVASGVTIDATNTTNNKITGTRAITQGENVAIEFTGIVNPTDAGTVYARILTFATGNADNYVSGTPGTYVDSGSVAFAITDGIAVSGDVLESLSFCVAGEDIPKDCNTAGLDAPTLKLGKDFGNGVVSLTSDEISTGDVYTQISTNAINGAVVRIKSGADGCGGLLRAGSGTAAERCGIAPAVTGGITAGEARFGVMTVAAVTSTGAAPEETTGTYQVAPASGYSPSAYQLRWAANNLSGVTSVYGDDFLDTDDAPVSNKTMQLTFGASANNTTPAGSYSADLSLIATGKF